jgi:glutamate N-acetyltransferase/amino-acid N-acetyltransferase
MKLKLNQVAGGVVAPNGFKAAGVFCDIKRLGTGKGSEKGQKRDLALVLSEGPATVAGMFTTNQICAAPVKVCAQRVRTGRAQAIVINSGNANACTGEQGLKDAFEMARFSETALALAPGTVLVGSTGRIGVNLPMDNIRAGIIEAAVELGSSEKHAARAAEAIMTSDTRSKQLAVEFDLGGIPVRIGGMCKGAGMIQPGMSGTGARPAAVPLHATMLCFLTTDAAVEAKTLQAALNEAVANSFNRITVDGDMSTNDTVLLLANGLASTEKSKIQSTKSKVSRSRPLIKSRRSNEFELFQHALNYVCLELAKMIVRDGEGVSRFVTVRVSNARTFQEADAAARAIANSPLVKTSWHGGDPNWGRIIDALGYSSARVVEEKVDIGYSAPGSSKLLLSLKRGQPTKASFQSLCRAVAPKEFDLHVNLNLGKGNALIYAADLTEAYVEFNKGDVTDPTSLGG